jgi:hypothetical protein
MAFELLAGRRPFEGEGMQAAIARHVALRPPPLEALRPELAARAAAIAAVIGRALAKDPRSRFRTAAEMRHALLEALAPVPERGRAGQPRKHVRRARRFLLEFRGPQSLRKLFVIPGHNMRFGRSRNEGRRGTPNDVILRVLPASDPANRAASLRLSQLQGVLSVAGDRVLLRDRSACGIRLDGRSFARDRPIPVPDSFELDLSGGVLVLAGMVLRDPRLSPRIGALVLRRRSNAPGHVYVLMVRELLIGGEGTSGLELPGASSARLRVVDGTLMIEALDGGLSLNGRSAPVGAPLAVAEGMVLRLGGIEANVREAEEGGFLAP